MKDFSILVVDDDRLAADSLAKFFQRRSYPVAMAADGQEGLERFKADEFDVVLLDIHLPAVGGLDLLKQMKELRPEIAVVMMTAYASIDSAIQALRLGAFDYVIKPFEPDEISRIMERLVERKELIEANREFSRESLRRYDFSNVITRDARFIELLESVKRVAATKVPVVVMGESGTGKELVARSIHNNSDRSNRPMIPVNCAAITPTLMESEFFGHVKGSFTGALSDHKGYFERAHKSTLFLDEIGELPLELQAKLLRVLQEGQINRVGESKPIELDFRLIVATQRDLARDVEAGRFRKDLYYRLNLFTVVLPPLRERPGDVPLLTEHFLSRSSRRPMAVVPEAMQALLEYEWPGNVRELMNVIERAAILATGPAITLDDLVIGTKCPGPEYLVRIPPEVVEYKSVTRRVADLAGRELILRALERSGGNISRAAGVLGVSRRFLTYKIRELGISVDESGEEDGD